MEGRRGTRTNTFEWKTIAALLVGNVLWLFANGRWRVDALAWVFPFFILYFLFHAKLWRGVAWLFVVNYLIQLVAWWGMLPVSGWEYYLTMLVVTAYFLLPFVVGRWLRPGVPGLRSTLVLPVTAVSLNFVVSSLSPYGTFGMLAYSQYDFPQILQIMALTGMWGVGFLIYWFGSLLYYTYQKRKRLRMIWRQFVVPALVYVAVLVFGLVRYGIRNGTERVNVVAFTAPQQEMYRQLDSMNVSLTHDRAPVDVATFAVLEKYHDTYFALAASVVGDSTQVVMSSEANLVAHKRQEAAVRERVARFSAEHRVVGVHGLIVYQNGSRLAENKVLAFDARGNELPSFEKAFVVPGPEDYTYPGGQAHRIVDLGFGKTGLAVCSDLDFPQWVQHYGSRQVGLMLSPASDWQAIDPYHAEMATFRAIENGFSLLRHTNEGRSLAVDGRRRIYAEADYFENRPHVLRARVPVGVLNAYYPYTNDLFAWVCVAVMFYMVLFTYRRPRARREVPVQKYPHAR